MALVLAGYAFRERDRYIIYIYIYIKIYSNILLFKPACMKHDIFRRGRPFKGRTWKSSV